VSNEVVHFLYLGTDLGLYGIDLLTPSSDYLKAFSNRGVPFFQSLFQLGPDAVEPGLRFLGKGIELVDVVCGWCKCVCLDIYRDIVQVGQIR
jgi:hypothetical protein